MEAGWYRDLIVRRYLLEERIPFLNLCGKTCQRYDSDNEFIKCMIDAPHIVKLFKLAKVTTLRDALAQKVLKTQLRCSVIRSSIFAKIFIRPDLAKVCCAPLYVRWSHTVSDKD